MKWDFLGKNVPLRMVWGRETCPLPPTLTGVGKLLHLLFPKLEMPVILAIHLRIQTSYG